MLIYGRSKWKLVLSETLHSEKCPSCNTLGSTDVQVYTKYAHVFWIPFCPLPKEILTICGHCKKVQTAKEMPAHIKEQALEIKKQVKMPFYYWVGAAALTLLVFSVFTSISEDNKKTASYAANPQIGDVYQVKLSSNSYTLFKVSSIQNDTVFFSINQYEVNKSSGLDKAELVNPASFLPIDSPITKKEITNKIEKGDILKIKRK